MNQRIGINASKELKNLKRRVKAPVLSYPRENSYFYDEDEDLDMNDLDRNDYEDDCCCISTKMKCTSKTACIAGVSVAVGLLAICLIRRVSR